MVWLYLLHNHKKKYWYWLHQDIIPLNRQKRQSLIPILVYYKKKDIIICCKIYVWWNDLGIIRQELVLFTPVKYAEVTIGEEFLYLIQCFKFSCNQFYWLILRTSFKYLNILDYMYTLFNYLDIFEPSINNQSVQIFVLENHMNQLELQHFLTEVSPHHKNLEKLHERNNHKNG